MQCKGYERGIELCWRGLGDGEGIRSGGGGTTGRWKRGCEGGCHAAGGGVTRGAELEHAGDVVSGEMAAHFGVKGGANAGEYPLLVSDVAVYGGVRLSGLLRWAAT